MATFLKNFLEREQKKGKNLGKQPPKTEKNRSQQLSEGQIAKDCADHKTAAAAQSNVGTADPKGQNQPGIKAEAQKNEIRKGGQPGTEWTQKTVYQSQTAAHRHRNGKMTQRFTG